MTEVPVIPADPDGLDFRFRVGPSILTEFAVSHTPADVLRELVQNEYDAGGTELTVEFGPDALAARAPAPQGRLAARHPAQRRD